MRKPGESMLHYLERARVLSVIGLDKSVLMSECCDGHFSVNLNKKEMIDLIAELCAVTNELELWHHGLPTSGEDETAMPCKGKGKGKGRKGK